MSTGRGRRRGQRWITEIPEKKWFAPEGVDVEEGDAVNLTFEELEAIRLVDLLELQQQEASFYMGISRKAFWNDLRSARKKVATALIYGLGIKIGGGSYALRGDGHSARPGEPSPNGASSFGSEDEIALLEREMQKVEERLSWVRARIEALKKGDG
jgi:predicted DNA-binding protein (UPF0251 family)